MAVDPVSLAIMAALTAAQMAMTASQKIKGPRLDDLNVSLADYGAPIPRIWGMRRINPQIIWAEQLREKKKKSKTKGGKYTEYKYYGTWAVLLCDHEIDAVTRIWFDKRLIYQTTSAGPISIAAALQAHFNGDSSQIKLTSGQNMRIYLGTETQEPDPRIESWCEDRYGADSCPAYRGSAYIVFENIPLETVGNRIPQITVEVVNTKNDAYPYETKAMTSGVDLFTTRFTPDKQRMIVAQGAVIDVWDIPTRTLIISRDSPITFAFEGVGPRDDGSFYAMKGGFTPELWLIGADSGGTMLTNISDSAFTGGCEYVGGLVCVYSFGLISPEALYFDSLKIASLQPGFIATHYFEDIDGQAWAVGEVSGENKIGFCTMPQGAAHIVDSPTTGQACAMDNGLGQFVAWQDGTLMLIDKETWTVTDSIASFAGGSEDMRNSFGAVEVGAKSIWLGPTEHDTSDLSVIRTVSLSSWYGLAFMQRLLYDPINHALIGQPAVATSITWFFLDRVGSDGTTLGDITDDVAGWCGMDPANVDTTALTQPIDGYSITQGAGKSMLEPLFDIHDVDPRPHDFSVQFKVRGSSPSGSIATADFVREGDSSRYGVTIQQDTDLPRRVTISFADRDKDQQTNNVIAQRPLDAVDSNREETIDLTTYVDTPDGAQQKVDRYFRRLWNSRERSTLALTHQKLGLEPGDVTTIELDGVSRNVKLDKMTIGPRQIDCDFVRDETGFAVVNTATTGPDMEGRDDEEIFIPGPVKGIFIDGPFVEDVDSRSNPIIYYEAGPYAGAFAGAVVAEGDGLDYDEVVGGVDSASDAQWGLATTALATANYNLWDRGNTVNINVLNGPLTSVTEAAINADPTLNLAAIGDDERWEYINFATATLESDGSYTLSTLKRGRRGTEPNVGNHAIGDAFVLLDNRFIEERGVDDIGENLSFKVQSPLRDIDAAPPIDFDYDATCLKPYAPCHLKASKSTDATIEWTRRTRLGGAWVGVSTIPLSEASVSYEVDIYSGVTFKRTLAVSIPAATYTAAEMTTDGTGSGFTAKVYQMSATVGRGFEASATFSF